jgi:DNA repair photolyase
MTTPDLFETASPAETKRQIMGGKPVFTVPAKTVINFKSKFDKKLLCDGITFTAGSACVYSCAFCYVEDMMRKQQEWNSKHGVTGDHFSHVVRRANAVEIARKQLLSKGYVRNGKPFFRGEKKVIYASPTVDVAANMELVKETVEICKVILELTNWDIRLLSKSNLLPKVAEALEKWSAHGHQNPDSKSRIIYGVSTGTLDDRIARAFEQGTPLVSKRIESLHWLQDNGFRTFGMICPSLPQEDYIQFAKEIYQAIRGERCEGYWTEVINLRGESFDRTVKALKDSGFNHDAGELREVSLNKLAWEAYARATFSAHAEVLRGQKSPDGAPKLKHLQYVTKDTRDWWAARQNEGAILL